MKYFPETEQLNQKNEKIVGHLQLPQPTCLTWGLSLHNSSTETKVLPVNVMETETGEQITPLDATCILLFAMKRGQRAPGDPNMWTRGFWWNYLLLIERETFRRDQAAQGLYN